MFTKSKITISGNILELYEFEEEIWHGPLPKQNRPKKTSERRKIGKRTESSLFRAKRRVKQLIDSNMVSCDNKLRPRFVTFTFKENVIDVKYANSCFTKFIRNFKSFLNGKKVKLKYITVIEFQKRGAVHYHAIFFNLPYFANMYDEMEKLWGHGFVISKKIDKVRSLSSYVCKYMVKEISDDRLYGQKSYFASRNMLKPRTIYNEGIVRFVADFMPEDVECHEKVLKVDHCGSIYYRRYDMSKHEELKNDLLAFIK